MVVEPGQSREKKVLMVKQYSPANLLLCYNTIELLLPLSRRAMSGGDIPNQYRRWLLVKKSFNIAVDCLQMLPLHPPRDGATPFVLLLVVVEREVVCVGVHSRYLTHSNTFSARVARP